VGNTTAYGNSSGTNSTLTSTSDSTGSQQQLQSARRLASVSDGAPTTADYNSAVVFYASPAMATMWLFV